jgi:hypothetical protein
MGFVVGVRGRAIVVGGRCGRRHGRRCYGRMHRWMCGRGLGRMFDLAYGCLILGVGDRRGDRGRLLGIAGLLMQAGGRRAEWVVVVEIVVCANDEEQQNQPRQDDDAGNFAGKHGGRLNVGVETALPELNRFESGGSGGDRESAGGGGECARVVKLRS